MFENVVLPYTLKPYQVEAVEAFMKCRHGSVVLPTGTGKTSIGLECMRRANCRTAVLVHTEGLLLQWVKNLHEIGVWAGVYYGKKKSLGLVTVCIVNSVVINPKVLSRFDFVICDEYHHLGGETFSHLLPLLKAKPYFLGLTSCLQRGDGREALLKKVAPIIYTMPIHDAMEKDFITKIRIYTMKASMTNQERMLYDRYTKTIRQCFFSLRTINPARLTKMKNNPLALACLSAMAKRKMLLSDVADKKSKVHKITSFYPEHERILVFCESKNSANKIFKYLTKNGIKCGIYHSGLDSEYRRRALYQWKKNLTQVMIACRCLDEGIDVPQCRIGVIVASGSSNRQWIQRQGRLLRKRVDNTKGLLFIVYCEGTIESSYSDKLKTIIRTC